jgi:hypothetical protein
MFSVSKRDFSVSFFIVGCRRPRWGRPDKLPQNHRQQFWWQFRREMALSDWTELAEKFH